jgi:hypothetical protein
MKGLSGNMSVPNNFMIMRIPYFELFLTNVALQSAEEMAKIESGDGVHESTMSLRFLRLVVSTFVLAFQQNAIHEQT